MVIWVPTTPPPTHLRRAVRGDDVDELIAIIGMSGGIRPSAAGRRRRRPQCQVGLVLEHHLAQVVGMVAPTPLLMFMPSGGHPGSPRPRPARGTLGAPPDGRTVALSITIFRPRSVSSDGKRPLAEFDITPRRIVQSLGFAQLTRWHAAQAQVNLGLDALFRRVGQLVAIAIENLMPLSANGLCEAEITNPACRRKGRASGRRSPASAAGQSARCPPAESLASSAASSM